MELAEAAAELLADVNASAVLESLALGKGVPKAPKARTRRRGAAAAQRSAQPKSAPFDTYERVKDVVQACRSSRKREREREPPEPLDDETMRKCARFTAGMALAAYEPFLHLVPRLVNIVTLAEAVPMPGSGLVPGQPLDLAKIAARCNGAYFAPKRFAAVQMAYTNPRSRILVFHTGRVVGTGCQGPMGARLAIARAQRQMADEAGVHLFIRNFAVINIVGASSLRATLNCEAFADAHPHDSHFDRSSFVGLAWRPPREACCVEVYSTGRMNLPGSKTERALNDSFSRMLPELLRYSSSARLLAHIPEARQAVHRPAGVAGAPVGVPVPVATVLTREPEEAPLPEDGDGDGLDDDTLNALGL